MTTDHIKVYKQAGSWYAECPCNAYRKAGSHDTAFDWALEHREEHRAAFLPALAPTAAIEIVHVNEPDREFLDSGLGLLTGAAA